MIPTGTGGIRLSAGSGSGGSATAAGVGGPVDARPGEHQVALDPGAGQQHPAGAGERQLGLVEVPAGVAGCRR